MESTLSEFIKIYNGICSNIPTDEHLRNRAVNHCMDEIAGMLSVAYSQKLYVDQPRKYLSDLKKLFGQLTASISPHVIENNCPLREALGSGEAILSNYKSI